MNDTAMLDRILHEVEATNQKLDRYEERLRAVEVNGSQPHIKLQDEVRSIRGSLKAADKRHDERIEELERHRAEQTGRSKGMIAGVSLAAGGAGAGLAKLIAWMSSGGH